MSVRTKRKQIKAATLLDDSAVTALTEQEEIQVTTEEKENYGVLDRLIDSVTRDFSRKGINSRLRALARKKSIRNAATICDHILAEQTELNIKTSTAWITSRQQYNFL